MNALDLVKAAKSATGDFGNFWTALYKLIGQVDGIFRTFGNWDADRAKNVGVAKDARTGYVPNTRTAFDNFRK